MNIKILKVYMVEQGEVRPFLFRESRVRRKRFRSRPPCGSGEWSYIEHKRQWDHHSSILLKFVLLLLLVLPLRSVMKKNQFIIPSHTLIIVMKYTCSSPQLRQKGEKSKVCDVRLICVFMCFQQR